MEMGKLENSNPVQYYYLVNASTQTHTHVSSLSAGEGKLYMSDWFIDQFGDIVQLTSQPAHLIPRNELQDKNIQDSPLVTVKELNTHS